jgi:hypothetical protein
MTAAGPTVWPSSALIRLSSALGLMSRYERQAAEETFLNHGLDVDGAGMIRFCSLSVADWIVFSGESGHSHHPYKAFVQPK